MQELKESSASFICIITTLVIMQNIYMHS